MLHPLRELHPRVGLQHAGKIREAMDVEGNARAEVAITSAPRAKQDGSLSKLVNARLYAQPRLTCRQQSFRRWRSIPGYRFF